MSQDYVRTKHRVFIFVVVVGYLKNRCEKLVAKLKGIRRCCRVVCGIKA